MSRRHRLERRVYAEEHEYGHGSLGGYSAQLASAWTRSYRRFRVLRVVSWWPLLLETKAVRSLRLIGSRYATPTVVMRSVVGRQCRCCRGPVNPRRDRETEIVVTVNGGSLEADVNETIVFPAVDEYSVQAALFAWLFSMVHAASTALGCDRQHAGHRWQPGRESDVVASRS